MISCGQAVQQLWEYLEDEVSEQDRGAVEEHLAFCRRCCGEVEFAEELRTVLEEAGEVELPPAVERRLVGVLDELEDEAGRRPTEGLDDEHTP